MPKRPKGMIFPLLRRLVCVLLQPAMALCGLPCNAKALFVDEECISLYKTGSKRAEIRDKAPPLPLRDGTEFYMAVAREAAPIKGKVRIVAKCKISSYNNLSRNEFVERFSEHRVPSHKIKKQKRCVGDGELWIWCLNVEFLRSPMLIDRRIGWKDLREANMNECCTSLVCVLVCRLGVLG